MMMEIKINKRTTQEQLTHLSISLHMLSENLRNMSATQEMLTERIVELENNFNELEYRVDTVHEI
jgi:predicted  nucleic acid-binding Zn-ribbon protein